MRQSTTLFSKCGFTAICVFLLIQPGLASSRLLRQDVPKDTPATLQLKKVIECVNQNDEKNRTRFLRDGFTDKDEFDNRLEIADQLHQRYSPMKFSKIVSADDRTAVAVVLAKTGVELRWEVEVAGAPEHLIERISMELVPNKMLKELPSGMHRLFREDGTTHPMARGVWEAKGYGYVLDIQQSNFRMFNVTKSFGWEQAFDEDLLVAPSANHDQIKLTFHPLEPGYELARLGELPKACTKPITPSPQNHFDVFVEVFESHYPFFETRQFDWEARLKKIRPTVTKATTEIELFKAMSAMIDGLGDGHVSLSAEIDGNEFDADTGGANTLSRLRESYEPSPKFKTYGRYFRDWRRRMRSSLIEDVLGGTGKVVANGQLIWGRADSDIGYLFIGGMGGYADGNTDAEVVALHQHLDAILNSLSDTTAMIIDVSFNGGGSDLFSLEIASRFADKRRVGFSKWPSGHEEYRNNRAFEPYRINNPDSPTYTKPIFLMTNDVTASAAEIFTMCMRALPYVTTVGLPTEGALSDILGKTLPNGWELGLSNEIYVDHEGVCHEGSGVPPMVKMDIFDRDDITRIGHADSIKRIVKLIQRRENE